MSHTWGSRLSPADLQLRNPTGDKGGVALKCGWMGGWMDGWLKNKPQMLRADKADKMPETQPTSNQQSPVTTSNIYQDTPKHPIKNNTPKTPFPKSLPTAAANNQRQTKLKCQIFTRKKMWNEMESYLSPNRTPSNLQILTNELCTFENV